jgi:hypothetical protein
MRSKGVGKRGAPLIRTGLALNRQRASLGLALMWFRGEEA